jgi:hypothetical protein
VLGFFFFFSLVTFFAPFAFDGLAAFSFSCSLAVIVNYIVNNLPFLDNGNVRLKRFEGLI